MNVVIYARYSSSNQTEQSIEGQLRDCYNYCNRMGYRVITEYIDRERSAFKDIDKRDEFQKMIKDARKRQFEMVILYAFDRFARNRYDSVVYKHKLKEYGVKVFSVTESFGEMDESMPYEAMLEWAAENYSRSLGKNAARGMRESALKGQITGGHVAFGYKVVDKKLEIDERAADGVRMVFDMYASGKTKAQIAAALNRRGFRTTLTGQEFTYNNVTHILANRLYIGDFTYKPGTEYEIKRVCPRIVTDEVFNACQERAASDKRNYGHKRSNVEYMLSGKLFCGHCGSAMTGDAGTSRNGAVHNYYTCFNKKRRQGCTKKSEALEAIERYVVGQTVEFILKPGQLEIIAKKIAAFHKQDCGADKIDEEKRRLAAVEKEINDCVDALIKTSNKTALQRINERLALLEQQKEDAELQIAKLNITASMSISAEDCEAWLQTFCNGDIEDADFRRRIIYAFVNSVFVYDDKIAIYYNIGELSNGKPITLAEHESYVQGAAGVRIALLSGSHVVADKRHVRAGFVKQNLPVLCAFCSSSHKKTSFFCGNPVFGF